MGAPSSSDASAVGSKSRLFPSGFESQLLSSFTRRSALIAAQLECTGEDGSIELPEEECSMWLEAMLLTSSDLGGHLMARS
jgi:hypothetical protein